MKRRALMRRIAAAAKEADVELVKVGQGKHEIWSCGGQRFAVPRHAEINELTAGAILDDVAESLGKAKGWWR
jgi:hypothetical protein